MLAKEWLLNSVSNRFQLNYKRNVGAVSESIRKCQPKCLKDWEEYYYQEVRSLSHIEELGRRLYTKISEVIVSEVEEITEQDCIDYMRGLVIDRTYDGYITEIKTIYGQLQKMLNIKIEAAPDEWDRGYNVDFFIKLKEKCIGLQIKPVSDVSNIPQIYKERALQKASHEAFKERFGGEVFYVFSKKEGDKKIIHNLDVVDLIKAEIDRINKENRNC